MNNQNSKPSEKVVQRSAFAEFWRNYKTNTGAMFGLFLIFLILALGVIGNFYFDYEEDIIYQDVVVRLQPPSKEHWFGTDEYGRDIFARVVYAVRYSMSIGLASVLISCVLGITLGAVAGYYGGVTENIIMRITDIIQAVPPILLGICLVSALGQSLSVLAIAVATGGIPPMVRITRASVMTVRDQEYVESAKAIGVRDHVIIFRHVLPNAIAPIVVQCTLRLGAAIIAIASLSFIGLGVPAPLPEWGAMLSSARRYIRGSSYMALFPGLAIMLSVVGFNLAGDGVRDALDPKLKK